MATTNQQLNVGIDADATGLIRATADASNALGNLQQDAAKLDASKIDVTPDFHLDQINRNIAMVQQALRKLDAQRADPNVELDSAKFLSDQRRLFNELRRLQKERVDIEANLRVNTTGFAQMEAAFGAFQAAGGGGGLTGLATGLRAVGTGGAAAAGGIAAVGVAAGVAEVKLGLMAADLETTKIQLDAVSGGFADDLLPALQEFSAASPFGMDEVTASARRLLAVGVDLQDIPGYLNDIGEVAAATGVPLDQIAAVFAQMEGKGKVTFEEMQQLAEAGLPVWQTLADSMGLSVEQVQKLATEGKLGADAIEDLRESLGDTFSGTMNRQAESFNGQMSTLKDNLNQVGQNLGMVVLPVMTEFMDLLNEGIGPLNEFSRTIADNGAEIRDVWGDVGKTAMGMGLFDSDSFQLWDLWADKTEEAAQASTDFGAAARSMASDVRAGVLEAGGALADLATSTQEAIDMDVRTRVHFIISQDDFQEQIEKSIAEGVTLPAKLKLGDIADLGDKKQALIEDIASFVDAGLSEGSRRAELNPQFDVQAWNDQVARKAGRLLIKAGIDRKEVDRVLENILGLKPTVKFDTTVTNEERTQRQLDYLANQRNAMFKPKVDSASYNAAQSMLNRLTVDETKTIFVTTRQQRGYRAMDEITNGALSSTSTQQNRQLAPKPQTRVSVYLDGEELADKTAERMVARATTTSLVRRA